MKNMEINKKEIAPGIVVYTNVIMDSENLYKDIENNMSFAGIKWNTAQIVNEDLGSTVNTKIRNTDTIEIPYKDFSKYKLRENISEKFYVDIRNTFFKNFDIIEKDYLSMYKIENDWHYNYAILKYGIGQEYTNHIDDHKMHHRRVSFLYYLNDNYSGGEINFPRFNITFKPKANQAIIFPSTYVYNHFVSPVVKGERYVVVSWIR